MRFYLKKVNDLTKRIHDLTDNITKAEEAHKMATGNHNERESRIVVEATHEQRTTVRAISFLMLDNETLLNIQDGILRHKVRLEEQVAETIIELRIASCSNPEKSE